MTTAKKTRNPKLLRIYDSIVYIYIHIDIDYRLQIYVCVLDVIYFCNVICSTASYKS